MNYAFDPEIAAGLEFLPQGEYRDLEAGRAHLKQLSATVIAQLDTSGVSTRDQLVPSESGHTVPVRIYTPDVRATAAVLLDVHGGGFTHGDLDTDHAANVIRCRDLGVVVVSVDYRLAPEAPFPAALEDCYAVLVWVAAHSAQLGVDASHIVLHGVSAGGGLCAALALLSRDRQGPSIAFQFLSMPALDDRLVTRSMRTFTDTPIWNSVFSGQSWDFYLGEGLRGTDRVSAYAAPARATDLTGLPPAYVCAMEYDPLRDENVAYAQALLDADVPVELHVFPGTAHGSNGIFPMAAVSQRQNAQERAVLASALGVQAAP